MNATITTPHSAIEWTGAFVNEPWEVGMSVKFARPQAYGKAAAAAFLAATLNTACAGGGMAQPGPEAPVWFPAPDRMTRLEDAFWRCDYTATTRGVAAAPLELCNAVYIAVKKEKFNGSFEDLLAWWSENKDRQHRELAATDAALQ